ncbi:Abi family protein [Shewanella sp. 5S214]|uniref:Abi family protein n=1 Tax=Shewanella sp. 5S214 TaxID=3229999 RepID=UPI00352F5DD1
MTIKSIKSSLSLQRLSTYLTPPVGCKTDEAALGAYLWNQEVSSVMGSVLHTIEISLRNAIYDSYLNYVKKHIQADTAQSTAANILAPVRGNPEMWFRMAFTSETNKTAVDIINSVKNKLKAENKPRTPENYIAKLTLGFWVALIDKAYSINSPENTTGLILWPPIRSDVFPNATRKGNPLGINEIRDELKYINTLRNRLAHHEPLWKTNSQFDTKSVINKVINDYQRCITVINWINPSMTKLLSMVDNHKRIKELCKIETLAQMMMLPVDLDNMPAEDLLANLSLIDETREGEIISVTKDGHLFIRDTSSQIFFTPKSKIKLPDGHVDLKTNDKVRFVGAPPKDPKRNPLALDISISPN